MSDGLIDPARRRLLLGSGGLIGSALAGCAALPAARADLASGTPFTLGVASGEPAADGFVIWTRLAPDPLAGGGMGEHDVEVEWIVAQDAGLARMVQRGRALAQATSAHAVHVEIFGLEADRWYFYGFRTAAAQSPIGRARTLPAAGAAAGALRIAVASCQHYESGYYPAFRHIAADAPDLVLHLGDYIYENAPSRGAVRAYVGGSCWTLADYRTRHAQTRLDIDLQAAHAACPWFMIWDDHEVQNDYGGLHPSDRTPPQAFALRRAAAYQAYYEHMPLRARARPTADSMHLYTAVDVGSLARLHLLDLRQYRDGAPCRRNRADPAAACTLRDAPSRELLGAAQREWLYAGLAGGGVQWQVLAQTTLMARFDLRPGPGESWRNDGWDGFPAERARLLRFFGDRQIANPVVLGGDMHSFWVTQLKADFDDPASATLASEFVGTSISSGGLSHEPFVRKLADNPHVSYFEARHRGYLRCDLTAQQWRTDLVVVDEADAMSAARVLKSFVVEAGRPGPQEA